jgi:tetratricopeptide (TPR) repeat protein
MESTHSMGPSLLLRRVGAALLALVSWAAAAGSEPSQKFIDGLRDRGLYETALDYLEQMRTSRLATPAFREVIDYEKATTLLAALRNRAGMGDRQRQLDLAQEALRKFLKEHPQHLLAAGANAQLADLLVERGRLSVDQATRQGKSSAEKAKLMGQARATYAEAEQVFLDAEKRFDEEHKKFPKGQLDQKQTEARDLVRRSLLHARLSLAFVDYEMAQTYAPGSTDNLKYLRDAAAKYKALFEKYQQSSYLIAYYARIGEARCYHELGEPKRAVEALVEPLDQSDDSEPFREMKNRATLLLLQVHASTKNYTEAALRGDAWLKGARNADELGETGAAIQYFTGIAHLELVRAMKSSDPKRAEELTAARRLLTQAGQTPGEYQAAARAKLGDPLLAARGTAAKPAHEPTNFAEAQARGQAALDRLQTLENRDREEAAAGKRDNHERNLAELAEARAEGFKYFQMALRMATRQTPRDELNSVRYYLAYLYWASDQPYEAAVMGDFLATRYPASPGARPAARIALAAYVKMFASVRPGDSREFESAQMTRIAQLITKRWPDQPEADEAWMMLIRSAVINGWLEKAVEYLEKVPASSPRRGEAELLAGQAMWASYLRAVQLPDAQRPKSEVLEKMIAQARKTLENGIARMKKAAEGGAQVTATLVNAMLSLAQISIESGNPAVAIELLEDPKAGALTLLSKNDPLITGQAGIPVEVYKAALRAYVGTQQLDKAEQVMKALDQMVTQKGDAQSSRTLTQIYIRLGHELQDQMERFRKEQKTAELEKVSRGFELFLAQILRREAGVNFHSLSWVAETFLSLGSGYDPGGQTLPPKAQGYYEQAAAAYRKLLDRAKADPKFAPSPESVAGVRVRLARCLRRLGQYPEAMDLLTEVLQERANFIDAQVEAAYTYQAWGEKKPGYYQLAIGGGRRYKKADGNEEYLVWGWGKISRMVATSASFAPVFFEARYNIPVCRLKYAVNLTGEERKAALAQAERDIVIVQMLYPEMGGPEWYARFDDFLRKIQELRGVPVVGLQGTRPASSPAVKAATAKAAPGK